MKTITLAIIGAAAATLLFANAPALADNGPPLDAVENATTAADHEALANAYEIQAEDARARAAAHDEKMVARYDKGPAYRVGSHRKGPMKKHCKRLTEAYNQAAEEFEQLAKEHREMASEAGQ